MIAFFVNILIALFWMFFLSTISLIQFVYGFSFGLIFLAIYSKLISPLDYSRRAVGFLSFFLKFIYAFVKANLEVAYYILFVPNSKLHPSTFNYDTSELTNIETLILSHVISLTPGTVSVDVSNRASTILIHSLNYKDPEQTEKEITRQFKNSILRFTR